MAKATLDATGVLGSMRVTVRCAYPPGYGVRRLLATLLLRLAGWLIGLGGLELAGTPPVPPPAREELSRALAEWDRRYREEPERFMSEAVHLLHCTPDTYGEAAAEYLLSLLAELRGEAAPPPPGDGGSDSLRA